MGCTSSSTCGVSSPTWTLLLAALVSCGVDVTEAAIACGFVATFVAALLLCLLATRVAGAWAALPTAGCLAIDSRVTYWSTSGMEVALGWVLLALALCLVVTASCRTGPPSPPEPSASAASGDAVAAYERIVQVAAGLESTCVRTERGRVACIGRGMAYTEDEPSLDTHEPQCAASVLGSVHTPAPQSVSGHAAVHAPATQKSDGPQTTPQPPQ